MHQGVQEVKLQEKFLSFALTGLLETCFLGSKIQEIKQRVEGNYVTTFDTLKSGFHGIRTHNHLVRNQHSTI